MWKVTSDNWQLVMSFGARVKETMENSLPRGLELRVSTNTKAMKEARGMKDEKEEWVPGSFWLNVLAQCVYCAVEKYITLHPEPVHTVEH